MINGASAQNRCYFSSLLGEHEADMECETRVTVVRSLIRWSLFPFIPQNRMPEHRHRRPFLRLTSSWVPQCLAHLHLALATNVHEKISPVMQTTKAQQISPFDRIFFFYITDQCFDIFPKSRFGSYSAPLFLCNNRRWCW